MRHPSIAGPLLGLAFLVQGSLPLAAQVQEHGYVLPLALAEEAAGAAVKACEARGYPVTATVVDVSGTAQVVLRGDHSTIHTGSTSFRKAYTVVTFGPIFHFDVSSVFADLVAKNPSGPALATTVNAIALPGAAAVKYGDEIVAAVGVSGSPGGDKDEACASAGVAAIAARVHP